MGGEVTVDWVTETIMPLTPQISKQLGLWWKPPQVVSRCSAAVLPDPLSRAEIEFGGAAELQLVLDPGAVGLDG
jgi:hypothetical protein